MRIIETILLRQIHGVLRVHSWRVASVVDTAICLPKLRESGIVVPILRIALRLSRDVGLALRLLAAVSDMCSIFTESGAVQLRKDRCR